MMKYGLSLWLMLLFLLSITGCKVNVPGQGPTHGLPKYEDRREFHVALQPGETFRLPANLSAPDYDKAYLEPAAGQVTSLGGPEEGVGVELLANKTGQTLVTAGDYRFVLNIFKFDDIPTVLLLSDIYNKPQLFGEAPFLLRGKVEPDEAKESLLQYFGNPSLREDWLLSDINSLMWVTNLKIPTFSQQNILALARRPLTRDGAVILYQEVRVVEPGEPMQIQQGQYLMVKIPETEAVVLGLKVNVGTGEVISNAANLGNGIVIIRGENPGKINLDIEVLKKDAILSLPATEITVAPSLVHMD